MTKQNEKDTLRRRNAIRQVGNYFTRPLAAAAGQDGLPAIRRGPVEEIYAAPEFEQMAELVLAPMQFDSLKSSARGSFDKMTFRQRLMVYAMELDLTTELFGHSMFAPIIVGPVSRQGDLHDEGELATARGSSASQTIMVATRSASYPIAQIASETTQPLWFQVYADDDLGAVRADVAEATNAGCAILCITAGVSSEGAPVAVQWDAIEELSQSAGVPVIVKGVMNLDDARRTLDHGATGLVVSNHGGAVGFSGVLPIDVLPEIADGIGDRAPVLVDGGFKRGSDILKGLALGAKAVMLARPIMWGLAAYGADGVERALYLLINELARNMAASGRPTIDMIDRALVRIDSR